MSSNKLSPLINEIYEGNDEELQEILNLIKGHMEKAQAEHEHNVGLQQIRYNMMPGNPRYTIDTKPGLALIEDKYVKQMEEAAKEYGYVQQWETEELFDEEPQQEEGITVDAKGLMDQQEEPDSISDSQEAMNNLTEKYKETKEQEKLMNMTTREAFMDNLQSVREKNASIVHKPKF